MLTGKYTRDHVDVEGRWRGGKDNFDRPITERAFEVIEAHVAHANDRGFTPAQLALAWNAAQPGVTAPIIGPRTREQLIDNLGAVDVQLQPEDFARVDAIAPPLSAAMPYYDAALATDIRPNLQRW